MNGDSIDFWLLLLDQSSQSGQYYSLPVLSGSMLPVLIPGKKIRIKRACWRNCHRGDIVVLKEGHRLTAHRLLLHMKIGKNWFIFQKGDSVPFGSWISADAVVGLVIKKQNADGSYVDLRSQYERKRNRTVADKQLLLDLYARLKFILKYVKRRLYK
jgi:hypothetical protein